MGISKNLINELPVKCDCDITWRQSLLIMVGGLVLAALGIALAIRWMV